MRGGEVCAGKRSGTRRRAKDLCIKKASIEQLSDRDTTATSIDVVRAAKWMAGLFGTKRTSLRRSILAMA